jgi:virulence-associated protein VagC
VFRNGGSQAIRLSRDFEVNAKEVVLRKDFGVISILPKRKSSLLALLKELGPIDLAPRAQPGWTGKRANAGLKPLRGKRRR